MGQWIGVAMLVLTGAFILSAWAWLWSGLTPGARRVSLQRCYPASSRAAIPHIQAVIWPLLPIAGATWIAVGALSARMILGRDPVLESSLVVLLFVLIALLAAWTLLVGSLPEWMYPGWLARRYYARHPDRARREMKRTRGPRGR